MGRFILFIFKNTMLTSRAGSAGCVSVCLACMQPINRYGQEFRQLLARPPDDKAKYKDHETLLSFYTEDVMRAAEREVWRGMPDSWQALEKICQRARGQTTR